MAIVELSWRQKAKTKSLTIMRIEYDADNY